MTYNIAVLRSAIERYPDWSCGEGIRSVMMVVDVENASGSDEEGGGEDVILSISQALPNGTGLCGASPPKFNSQTSKFFKMQRNTTPSPVSFEDSLRRASSM
ncbi:hypothetical protein AA313_de0201930 [Arthrobotrys entomopaga]|nr:hypothetical protein AA313_de0201930 [Arthrobotrys entomopaga]